MSCQETIDPRSGGVETSPDQRGLVLEAAKARHTPDIDIVRSRGGLGSLHVRIFAGCIAIVVTFGVHVLWIEIYSLRVVGLQGRLFR